MRKKSTSFSIFRSGRTSSPVQICNLGAAVVIPQAKSSVGTVCTMAFEDTLLGLAIGLLMATIVYTAMRYRLKSKIAQIEAEFRRMWAEQESGIRRDATDRSRYVIKGKLAEHMVPLLSDVFKHDPSDARFIGSPIDYLIFEGLTAAKDGPTGGPVTVILADIKTGEAVLSSSERRIKEAIDAGRVKWETIRVQF